MATIKFEHALLGGSIEISGPISGYQELLAELKKQDREEIRKVFAGEKSITLKAGAEAPAVELIPIPLSAPIEKPSATGETWEQFCKRFGGHCGHGGQETFRFRGEAAIERDFFESYGPKATITLVRRQIFAALVDAMKEVEGQQCR